MINGEQNKKSEIMLRGRSDMTLCGVEEVLSFDEVGVHLKTVDGELYIEGRDIKIGTLDTDNGRVELCGRVNGFYYAGDPEKQKKGFFARLTR